jgi:hypothetical protein
LRNRSTLLDNVAPRRAPLNLAAGPPGGPSGPPETSGSLDKKLCQVGGINQNYTSAAGTLYHIQIEDLGPIVDRASEAGVRRVNVIVYANYGEQNAHIVHGHDHDYPDIRTHAHNTFIKSRIADLAAEARRVIEEAEQKQVMRIKCLIREYYLTKSEVVKKEFEEANTIFPFLFSRAFIELRNERATAPPPAAAAAAPAAPRPELVAPVEEARSAADILRELAGDIERMVREIDEGVQRLKAAGKADDILVQTCRKMTGRARETLAERDDSGFTVRRLEMTRNSLTTTWRQVQSRLKGI